MRRLFLGLDDGRVSNTYLGGQLGGPATLALTRGSADPVTVHIVSAGALARLSSGWQVELVAVEGGVAEPSHYVIQTLTAAFDEVDTGETLTAGSYGYLATPVTATAQADALLGLDGIPGNEPGRVLLAAQLEVITGTGASPILSRPFVLELTAPLITSGVSSPGSSGITAIVGTQGITAVTASGTTTLGLDTIDDPATTIDGGLL
jgi:hypothetical protein